MYNNMQKNIFLQIALFCFFIQITIQCLDNQYLDTTTNQCYNCNLNCSTCLNFTQCTSCTTSYFLNLTTSICSACDDSCFSCNDSISCTSCYSTNYLNISSKLCVACDPSCRCVQSKCIQCRAGYSFDSIGNCLPDTYPSNSSNHVIIIPVVVGVILGIILLIIFIRVCIDARIRKHFQNLNKIQPEPQIQKSYGQVTDASIRQVNDIQINDNEICMICLENHCDLITNCNHCFHSSCLKSWITKNIFCPICRNQEIGNVEILLCLDCRNQYTIMNIFDPYFIGILKTIKKHQHKCPNDINLIAAK